jgi:uncharacterized protein
MRHISSGRFAVSCVAALVWSSGAAAGADLRLIDALKAQDAVEIRALLDAKVDVNAQQPDGATALHWAAHWNDLATAARLIEAGAAVDVANELGVTPLALACENGNGAMAEKLLRAGANPNSALPSGETPLMTAALTGSVEVVRALLTHGADVNAQERSHGQTPLMWAAARQHATVVRVLIEAGADVRARTRISPALVHTGDRFALQDDVRGVVQINGGGFSPLLFAARNGDVESARLLLAAGASVDDVTPDGTSALVVASHSGHGPLASLLLQKGADPNAGKSGYTALHAAVLRGDLELVKSLIAHGAHPNVKLSKGTPVARYSKDFALGVSLIDSTPFLLAARFAEPDIMRALAAGGADPTIAMPDGTTALMLSAGVGWGEGRGNRRDQRMDATEITPTSRARDELSSLAAVTAAAELGGDINAVNRAGDTALHGAAAKRWTSVIRYLVDKGATLEVKNKRGQTPLALAVGRGEDDGGASKSAQDLLRKLGAKD